MIADLVGFNVEPFKVCSRAHVLLEYSIQEWRLIKSGIGSSKYGILMEVLLNHYVLVTGN